MISLLEIDGIDYDTEELTAVFDGIFREGFIVRCSFTYDDYKEQKEDLELGLGNYYLPNNIILDNISIEHEEIKVDINKREMSVIKNEIENKLTELLEIYLND